MYRKLVNKLCDWFRQADRKPLVIRGARQVGKTWIIRHLAEKLKLDLLELNFESDPTLKTFFNDNDPNKTILMLESFLNKSIDRSKTLLFLDEIQCAAEVLAKLRWFAEQMPELAIIATGSLLDFVLAEHEFSMPVGRISYMYLEPMSFEEFLLAKEQNKLCEYLATVKLDDQIPAPIHQRLLELLREYIVVGGLPAAVNSWMQKDISFTAVSRVQHNILQTYRDDFAKYAKKMSTENLEIIFRSVPRLLGKKFKYRSVSHDVRHETLKKALELLCRARICHKVINSSANGIPLGAEIKPEIFKVIFLDIGLISAALGLSFVELHNLDQIKFVNEGGLAEQLIGQLLRSNFPDYIDPSLYYWVREQVGAESEIDYLIQHNTAIIPIEVKAGTTGTLRSLHTFMHEKNLKLAVRFNMDYPSVTEVKVKNHKGELIEYSLISLPLYLAEQIHRLLSSVRHS